jgi:hypothetical protein
MRNGCTLVSGIAFGPTFASRSRASPLVRPLGRPLVGLLVEPLVGPLAEPLVALLVGPLGGASFAAAGGCILTRPKARRPS